jgi:hypothetical protein
MQKAVDSATLPDMEANIDESMVMVIDRSDLFSCMSHPSTLSSDHQIVPFNSPPARFVDEEMHCLPLEVPRQETAHCSEDSSMFFDRHLVEQMLSSRTSTPPRNAAFQLGGSDYPIQALAEDAQMQCDLEMNSCSPTYVESPMTPPNQISSFHSSPQSLLYHPQPRYFDATSRIIHSVSCFHIRDPGSPLRYKSPLPLTDSDCGSAISLPPRDVLRKTRPRATTGLGIYQVDNNASKNRRPPVPSALARNPKRAREEDDGGGESSDRSKRLRGLNRP